MIEVSETVEADVAAVMAVLSDGWLYGLWVVGASHIRDVDSSWPQPGTRIHHAVGAWPLLIRDNSESKRYDPDGLLELVARGWPIGEALVRVQVYAEGPGRSRIVLGETVTRGPGRLVKPLERMLITPRNRESLHRLVAIVQGRIRSEQPRSEQLL